MILLDSTFALNLMSIFLLGFLGSMHCLGMCGPILSIALSSRKHAVRKTVLYNLSRLFSYLVIGSLFSTAGQLINLAPIQNAAGLVGTLLMIAIALNYLAPSQIQWPRWLTAFISQVQIRLQKKSPRASLPIFLGLISGLLPCGLLLPAYALALASESLVQSWVLMTVFALGTWPAMFIVGFFSERLWSSRITRHYRVIVGILILITGISTLAIRFLHTHHGAPHSHEHHH